MPEVARSRLRSAAGGYFVRRRRSVDRVVRLIMADRVSSGRPEACWWAWTAFVDRAARQAVI